MTDYAAYFDEVIQAHESIERWFAVEQEDAALEHLLTRFSPAFSKIGRASCRERVF